MDVKNLLLSEHSRVQSGRIMELVIDNPKLIGDLIRYANSEDVVLAQRASWPLGLLGTSHFKLFTPYIRELIQCLEDQTHPAVSRNAYRVLQFVNIPEEYEGILFELCARDLSNPKSPVAIKVFCMTVAYNICLRHPDLKPELKLLIESGLEHSTAGYRSRSRKLLKLL